jgi:hypothetical protein
MKKVLFVMLLVAALATPVMAGTVTITAGTIAGGNNGGPFTLTVDTGGAIDMAAGTSFQTFCIEKNEYIQMGWSYAATLSHDAVIGGVAGGQPDPISVGTGWLFSQFATTAGFANNPANATALQEAIWWLEQEITSYTTGNAYMAQVAVKFGSDVNGQADGGWDYGVQAVNLTRDPCTSNGDGRNCQSLLAYAPVPDGGTTLMLLGGALVGLGALRRKFRL